MVENNQTKSKESNGRGGRRANAGRKAGSATVRTREIADKAMESGISPLEFMLSVMRAEPDPERMTPAQLLSAVALRFEAAKAAAPYMHPKLASVEHSGPDGGPVKTENKWVVELVRPGAKADAS